MLLSGQARNRAALAMSEGSDSRPRGMVAMNLARFSGVSAPMKSASSGVSPATGLMAHTRIFLGASSAAIDLVIVITAPLEELYQVRPGRGRTPAVDAVLMITPPPRFSICGTQASAAR